MAKTPLQLDEQAGISSELVDKVKYNGFVFPLAKQSTARFSPVYDESERAIKYTEVELTIDFYLHAGLGDATPTYIPDTSVDSTFNSLRHTLSQPGQVLQFESQGMGTFTVGGVSQPDVDFGPKPRVIQWKPVGGKLACRVLWVCTARIIDCPSPFKPEGSLLQVPYEVSWNIRPEGTTVRTVTGEAEISLARKPSVIGVVSNTDISTTADAVREQIVSHVPPLPQFNRSYNFTLSKDRKRLSFTITDEEINSPVPYHPGIVRTDINYDVSSSLLGSGGLAKGVGFHRWECRLSGNIQVAAGYSKMRAWVVLIDLLFERFTQRAKEGAKRKQDTQSTEEGEASPFSTDDSDAILTEFSLGEAVYGRDINFNFAWVLTTTINSLFASTGIFQPVRIPFSRASWDLWRASMDVVQDGRGFQEMNYFPTNDIIIDICQLSTGISSQRRKFINREEFPKQENGVLYSPDRKEQTYIAYESTISVEREEGTAVSKPQTVKPPSQESPNPDPHEIEFSPKPAEQELYKPSPGVEAFINSPSLSQGPPILQRIHNPLYIVTLKGAAMRLGLGINPPNLVAYGGRRVAKYGVDYIEPALLGVGTSASTGVDYNIYGTRWRKSYIVTDEPFNNSIVSDHSPAIYT